LSYEGIVKIIPCRLGDIEINFLFK